MKPVWRIMVDQQLQLDDMVEPTSKQWKKWEQAGKKEVYVVQLDIVGENKSLKK